MPPIRSQGGLALCGTFAAATAMDFLNCKQKGIDCSKLPLSEQISSLDLSTYRLHSEPPENTVETELNAKIYISGFASDAIKNLYNLSYSISRESCAPYESLFSLSAKTIDQTNLDMANLKKDFEKMKSDKNFALNALQRTSICVFLI